MNKGLLFQLIFLSILLLFIKSSIVDAINKELNDISSFHDRNKIESNIIRNDKKFSQLEFYTSSYERKDNFPVFYPKNEWFSLDSKLATKPVSCFDTASRTLITGKAFFKSKSFKKTLSKKINQSIEINKKNSEYINIYNNINNFNRHNHKKKSNTSKNKERVHLNNRLNRSFKYNINNLDTTTYFFSGVDDNWKITSLLQSFNHTDFKFQSTIIPHSGFRDGGMLLYADLTASMSHELILFGGLNASKAYNEDIFSFDLQTTRFLGNGFKRQRFSILDLEEVYILLGGREPSVTASSSTLATSSKSIETSIVNISTTKNSSKKTTLNSIQPNGDTLSDTAIIIPKSSLKVVESWQYIKLDTEKFPPREWTSCTSISSTSGLLFGGVNSSGALNDAYIVSFNNLTLTIQPLNHQFKTTMENTISSTSSSSKSYKKISNTSNLPPPRSGHNMIEINEIIYIIGGEDSKGDGLNDVWKFDPKTLEFSEFIPNSSNMNGFLGSSIFPMLFSEDESENHDYEEFNGFCVYGGVTGWNHDTKIIPNVNCVWIDQK